MTAEARQALISGELAGMAYTLGQPQQAPVGASGIALGRRAGSSLEFREYRDYQPGDDIRHIDWSAYARSDQLSIKLFREEVTPHLDLVVDNTRSMALENTAKAAAALSLAAFLAAAAANGGYSHRAWLVGDRLRAVENGAARPPMWEGIDFGDGSLPAGLTSRQPAWRPRGIRVVISDLFWPGEPSGLLQPLAEGAATMVVIQLLAQADVAPASGGSVRLLDAETGESHEILLDTAAVARYRAALGRHQGNWARACRQVGGLFLTVVAEKFLADWRLDELVAAGLLKVS
jgi:uncharacterized protein (DUF58 family)